MSDDLFLALLSAMFGAVLVIQVGTVVFVAALLFRRVTAKIREGLAVNPWDLLLLVGSLTVAASVLQQVGAVAAGRTRAGLPMDLLPTMVLYYVVVVLPLSYLTVYRRYSERVPESPPGRFEAARNRNVDISALAAVCSLPLVCGLAVLFAQWNPAEKTGPTSAQLFLDTALTRIYVLSGIMGILAVPASGGAAVAWSIRRILNRKRAKQPLGAHDVRPLVLGLVVLHLSWSMFWFLGATYEPCSCNSPEIHAETRHAAEVISDAHKAEALYYSLLSVIVLGTVGLAGGVYCLRYRQSLKNEATGQQG